MGKQSGLWSPESSSIRGARDSNVPAIFREETMARISRDTARESVSANRKQKELALCYKPLGKEFSKDG